MNLEAREKENELVVFAVRSRDSKCSECEDDIGRGGFLRKEGDRGLCLDCADLGDLVFSLLRSARPTGGGTSANWQPRSVLLRPLYSVSSTL